MRIVCHCLVENEENFVWYALNSVINLVDEVLVWSTGSTDKTNEIIKSIASPKIKFQDIGSVDAKQLTKARNDMLSQTNADWIFILDGDEIWHQGSLANIIAKLPDLKGDVVVSLNKLLVGDMFHYLPESAGKYQIGSYKGHFNIRFLRNLPSLGVYGEYPLEYYSYNSKTPVQNLPKEKLYFDDNYYLHASFLPRSSKDRKKIKYEVGESFPLDYYYPEALFTKRPKIVSCVWQPMSFNYKLKAYMQTPLKKLKRSII